LTSASGIPVADNQNSISAGRRGPLLLQDLVGNGSHTFSMINAAGGRVWVKWHLKTQQGIKNLSAARTSNQRAAGRSGWAATA
jgi:catalase